MPLTLGPWAVVEQLDEGATSTIWLVEGRARRAAAKVVRAPDGDAARAAEPAFEARLEALADLVHPGINQVLDWGRLTEEPGFWIALELLDGARLHDLASAPSPLRIAAALTDALAAAHAQGIVHGDLKPHNVIVEPDGRAVLVDFALPIAGHRDSPFEPGAHGGTPAWLAPECFAGAPASAAADVYALAQLLIERFAGAPAFPPDGRGPAALVRLAERKANTPALPVPDVVPEPLRGALRAATDADPGRRPTAAALAEAARIAAQSADDATPSSS
jgi:serine/threonine protein kinase